MTGTNTSEGQAPQKEKLLLFALSFAFSCLHRLSLMIVLEFAVQATLKQQVRSVVTSNSNKEGV